MSDSISPFDFISSINDKKYLMVDPEIEKQYSSFVINKGFSQFVDSILFAAEMNKMAHMPAQMQYDFLYHSIRKGKRFSKWAKNAKEEDLQLIIDYYQVNKHHAVRIAEMLTEEEIAKLEKYCSTGGRGKVS